MDCRYWAWLLVCAASACTDRGAVLSAQPDPEDEISTLELVPARSVEAISANDVHTCVLSNGIAFCWGDNTYGQIGGATDVTRGGPTAVPGGEWQSIVTGATHTCALDRSGAVFCWGGNERGELGQGHHDPLLGTTLVPLPAPALQLAGGFYTNCAILDNSELWCWGDGNEGQIGRGDYYPGTDSREADAATPERVSLPEGGAEGSASWSFVDTGQGHTCALRSDGSLWCWGRNTGRQLGQPSDAGQVRQPVRVGAAQDWQSLDAAQNYTCGLKADRSLWCWGFNMGWMSDAGNPFGVENVQLDVPTQVGDEAWAAIGTNMFHTCGLDDTARLWCWGRNHEGQLAMENPPDPDDAKQTVNVHPRTLVATGVARVGVGTFSTCVVSLDGAIRCVGKNDRGQLGEEPTGNKSTFVGVLLPAAP